MSAAVIELDSRRLVHAKFLQRLGGRPQLLANGAVAWGLNNSESFAQRHANDVRFTVASVDPKLFPQRAPERQEIVGSSWLWLEIEPPDNAGPERLESWRSIALFTLTSPDLAQLLPTLVIDNGSGYSALWKLERCTRADDVEAGNGVLINSFRRHVTDAKFGSADISHALRLPGTTNSATGRPVSVVSWNEQTYRIEQFRAERSLVVDEPLNEERSDLGLARRLVRLYGHELRHFRARRTWLVWDGCRWAGDQTGEIVRRAKQAVESLWEEAASINDEAKRSEARKWALRSQSSKCIASMVQLAETEPGVPVTTAALDSDPWLLNTRSGVVDLRTGKLSEPRPDLLQTKVCAAPYAPGARSELWDHFVGMLFGEDAELRSYVQRALGVAVFGAWREKAFWFGYGPPDGGKSTFLGVIGDVLGDYHVSADASTWMIQAATGGNRGDVTRLLGARLVTTLEVRASARFDQQLMKKVTGGDTLVAAAKYEADIEFAPSFSLWFGANDRPVIPDDDEGFWSRVRCVPFTRPVPKRDQDPALREKLASPEHAPAVLAWLVEGCLAWQRDGLGTCRAVQEATTAYRRDTNQAVGFFDDCLRVTPGASVPVKEVRAAYAQWARENAVRVPLSDRGLAMRLRQLGATGGDDSARINRERHWLGIELRQAQERVF